MILLVEDNNIQRRFIRSWLEQTGVQRHAIIDAEWITPALEIFLCNQDYIKILLMDYFFTKQGDQFKAGVDMIKIIRESERNASLEKGCFILGFSSDSRAASTMLAAGADMFLSKPLKKEQIVDLVTTHYME